MLKKCLALALVIALVFTSFPTAKAADAAIGLQLYKNAYTTDDGVTKEYAANSEDHITMKAGEHYTTDPFHGLDQSLLSYTGVSVKVDNPKIVAATIRTNMQGSYVGNGHINRYACLDLYALKSGTTKVTVTYNTVLTAHAEEKYVDKRSGNSFSMTYVITVVGEPLYLSVETNTKSIVFEWNKAYLDALIEEETQEALGNPDQKAAIVVHIAKGALGAAASVGGVMLAGALTASAAAVAVPAALATALITFEVFAVSTLAGTAINNIIEAVKGTYSPSKGDLPQAAISTVLNDFINKKFEMKVGKIFGSSAAAAAKRVPIFADVAGAVVGIADELIGDYVIDALSALVGYDPLPAFPVWDPKDVTATVTIYNPGDEPVRNVELTLATTNISMNIRKDTVMDVRVIPIAEIPAQGEYRLEVPLVPSEVYHTSFDTPTGQYVHVQDATVTAQIRYQPDGVKNTVLLSEEAKMVMFSNISWSDREIVEEYRDMYTTNAYQHNQSIISIMCPVDVVVQDINGTELATISNFDDKVLVCDGVIAFADGETKYLLVSHEYQDQYQFRLKATDDGTMSIVACSWDDNRTMESSVYSAVGLTKDQTFVLDVTSAVPVQLMATQPDGLQQAVEGGAHLTTEALQQEVMLLGVSENDAFEMSEACLRGLLTAAILDEPQGETTLEELAAALVRFYELQNGLLPGYIEQSYLEQATDEMVNPGIGAALLLSLIPNEYADQVYDAKAAKNAISRGDAAKIIAYAMRSCSVFSVHMAAEYDWSDYSKIKKDEELLASVNELYTMGIVQSTKADKLVFSHKEPFTHSHLAVAMNAAWEHSAMLKEAKQWMFATQREQLDGMTNLFELDMGAYSAPEEWTIDTDFPSFSFYMPTVPEYIASSSVSDISLYALSIASALESILPESRVASRWEATEELLVAIRRFDAADSLFVLNGQQELIGSVLYLEDDDGSIIGDKLYLVLLHKIDGVDEEYYTTRDMPIDTSSDVRARYMLIGDQEVVMEYLRLVQPQIQAYVPEANAPQYETLKKGDNGDAVVALQEQLIRLGYLQGTATGKYDSDTVNAVKAFQTDQDLKATGKADQETQMQLYGTEDDTDLLLDWMTKRE